MLNCKGCGETWPCCAERNRGQYSGIEHAKHYPAATYLIDICPNEPRATITALDGSSVANMPDIDDCTRPGDCEPACRYLLNRGISFLRIAQNSLGEYEHRRATDEELTATARAIYHDSAADFTDITLAKVYLVWSATNAACNEYAF